MGLQKVFLQNEQILEYIIYSVWKDSDIKTKDPKVKMHISMSNHIISRRVFSRIRMFYGRIYGKQ